MTQDPVIISQAPTPPLPPWEFLPPQAIVMIVFAVAGASVLILWPLVRAIARRIEGRTNPKLAQEIETLRERVEAMEQSALTSGEYERNEQRAYELEERVEFVERLLSRGKETAP